jgi:hypothetical protein
MKTPDSKALKTLLAYTPVNPDATSAEDFAHAKRTGLMFDPISMSHDDILSWAFKEFSKCDRSSVADSFLLGIELNEAFLRAAISAYAVMTNFPKHVFTRRTAQHFNCDVCGIAQYDGSVKLDLSFLNKCRWTGAILPNRMPDYLAFYLQQHNESQLDQPSELGVNRFCEILDLISLSSADETPSTLHKKIRKMPGLKMSVEQARGFVETLGYCGILHSSEHRGFIYRYVGHLSPTKSRSSDWGYPVDFWTGQDGVNIDALKYWFSNFPAIANWKPPRSKT